MFRVFGCDGEVGDDILIAAFNRAYESGADVISASLGGASGWTEEPWTVVVSRIVANGVPCTLSAGNSGDRGLWFASSASDGKGVTSVASVENIRSPMLFTNATFVTNNARNTSFAYSAGSPANWTGVTLPLWAVNYNTTDDANGCEPYPSNTTDLSGYIVLIRRGTCLFTQKVGNAVNKGAKYVIIYNNAPGMIAVDASEVNGTRAIAMVTADQGESWISALSKGEKVTVAMTDPRTAPKSFINDVNKATGGYISAFSSWGPTYEADLKPQLASPGGQILSTYPRAKGSYAVLSGTSMACPLTAAIYALVMEARNTKDPRIIENVLSATAKPNIFQNTSLLAPVPQQGAGLIQAYDAAYATTILSTSSLAFNDSDNHIAIHNFSISNTGRMSVIYTFSNVGAATAYTYSNLSTIYPAAFPNQMSDSYATIKFLTGDTITIPAGQRRIIQVAAEPPKDVNVKRLPVYSGYIAINGSDGSALSLPYMGVVGSMKNLTVLDPRSFLVNSQRSNATRASRPGALGPTLPYFGNMSFVLPPPGHVNDTAWFNKTALPVVTINLVMGSPLVRVDVVPIGAICGNRTLVEHLGYRSLGQLDQFPVPYNSRNDPILNVWDGKLADGTYAPSGTYKMVIRALHIYGDRNKAEDYDIVETQPFSIRYYKSYSLQRRQAGIDCSDVVRRWQ